MKILKEEILKLRNQGKTYKQIRSELNCTLSVISYHCRRNQMAGELARHKPSINEIEKINNLYKDGKNLKQICDILNRTKNCVKKYIVNYNSKRNYKNITKVQSVVQWRQRTKLKLVNYKGGCCSKCGYNKCSDVLQFHHLDPKEKDFNIGGKSWSFEKLKSEVDKCILLCANCHIELHKEIRECS